MQVEQVALGGRRTGRLVGSQLSRLRAVLRTADVVRFAYLAEGRGDVYRLRRLSGSREQLLHAALPSGTSALDAPTAGRFWLTQAAPAVSVVYADRDEADHLASSFALQPAAEGDVLLRVSGHPVVNDAVVALFSASPHRGRAGRHVGLAATLRGNLRGC